LQRKEAVALIKELDNNQLLVSPNMVIIENQKAGHYQIKIKGEYNYKEIEIFLKNREYSYKISNDYLIIYKP
jgi:hypothetical protein